MRLLRALWSFVRTVCEWHVVVKLNRFVYCNQERGRDAATHR